MKMTKKTKMPRWVSSLLAGVTLVALAGVCQAQTILYDFNSGLPAAFYDGVNPAGTEVFSNNPTAGPDGSGCLVGTFDGVTTTEIDPAFNVTFNTSGYLQVELDLKIDPGSGTTGNAGSGGNGNLQVSLRDASYSWNGLWYGAIFPPADTSWVHYTFIIPHSALNLNIAHVQIQLQGSAGYSAPVAVYIDNVQITELPNPWVFTAFTSTLQGITPDPADDAPFYSPVDGSGPTSFTPAGSWGITIANPGGYSGWNQYGGSPGLTLDLTRYQYIGFDVKVDSSSGTSYGGTQLIPFDSGWSVKPALGAVSFNSSMVGTWTHFNFPSAASGNSQCPALVFQGTPGSDGGTNTTTFHIDNIVFWNPVTKPTITAFTRGTAGGLQISVDADGTNNINDQEGICAPRADCDQTNFFWVNQFPASYSMTLTNFPSPTVAPSFDAHIYVVNGDTFATATPPQDFHYNQTYSGVNWNAGDMIALDVQNATNGGVGVVASFSWKTNLWNSNPSNYNVSVFPFPSMANANGTWTLGFNNNTDGYILAPDNSSNSITLPDFSSVGNFTPATSMVAIGVWKAGIALTTVNNNQGVTFTHVGVKNTLVNYDESFPGPGLTGDIAWQNAAYYIDAADRAIWIPSGTAWWLKWDTTASGWGVQSAPDLTTWGSAGVTYTYVDSTGTNTLGAVPAAGLPEGADFFRLTK